MDEFKQKIIQKLKAIGLNETKEREACIDLLVGVSCHFSLNTLVNIAEKNNLNLSRASIYRNALVFEEIGFLKKVRVRNRQQYYEVVGMNNHHEHLFCKNCNKHIEFDDTELNEYFNKIFKKFKFLPIGHKVDLFGICLDCQLNNHN